MGKYSLVDDLAKALDTSTDKAARWVDDLGANRADEVAQTADEGGQVIGDWWKPVAATGGLAGGGALVWRQQDIQRAKAIADQQDDYSTTVEKILASDMTPARKRELIDQINSESPAAGSNKNNDGGGLFGGGGIEQTLILIVVIGLVLRYTLGSDGQ